MDTNAIGAVPSVERFELAEGVVFEVRRNADGSYVRPEATAEEAKAFADWWMKVLGRDDFEEGRG